MSNLQSKPEAAVFYTSLGWSILPLHNIKEGKCSCNSPSCRSPGKHPRVPHGVKDSSKDPEQVKRWWARWPEANIGVAAGKASGFFILDIDGPMGIKTLETKSADLINSTLPVVKTGSGTGRHLYFKPFLDKTPNGVRVAPDIDIKGDFVYINHLS